MKHKTQHWIPQSYLAAWTDPDVPDGQEPFVWVVPKDGGTPRKKAPKNLFAESDMYTIHLPDGSRDLSLEHGLSDLESRFATIRREVLETRGEIDEEARLVVAAFTAAMHARTPKQRDHWQAQWQGLLDDMDAMQRAMLAKSPKERAEFARAIGPIQTSGPSMSHDDVRRLAKEPLQVTLAAQIDAEVGALFAMDCALMYTDADPGFITSDAPCIWWDAEARNRPWPYNAVGVAFPTIEILLPVSPHCALMLNRKGRSGYFDLTEPLVDEFNRYVRAYANESFVVQRPLGREIWLDDGTPPR